MRLQTKPCTTFFMHLVLQVKAARSALYKHVFIPLIGWSVEEAPAGCILGCHRTPVQTAQHGHHIVLDGTCDREVLQELGSAAKPHTFSFHASTKGFVFSLMCGLTCVSCTRRSLHCQTPWKHSDVSLVSGERRGSHRYSVHLARWSADWCVWLWRSLHWTNRNLGGTAKWVVTTLNPVLFLWLSYWLLCSWKTLSFASALWYYQWVLIQSFWLQLDINLLTLQAEELRVAHVHCSCF